jgi:hypothetical protein
MQPDAKCGTSLRFGGLGVLAIAAIAGVPSAATASTHLIHPPARTAAAAGLVYGGQTSQGWPVVIQLSKNRRQVALASAGLHLTCTDDLFGRLTDRYARLPVNRRRKFGASFGPTHVRQDDGTVSDFTGSISGAFNRARSKVSGRWRLQVTDHDTSGGETRTCDSGNVRWSARQ